MTAKFVILAVSLFLCSLRASAQSPQRNKEPLKFMGRRVTITEPDHMDDFFPKGPASLCVEGLPQRQCYTAPQAFGNRPTVTVVQLEKDVPALLFSAESGGVSGWQIHFALLRPGTGKDLLDLFPSTMSISNQSQYAFWNDSNISDAPIFVTADYVWGPDESHYEPHRYIISAYTRRRSSMIDELDYHLEDQYMTVHAYDLDANADILASEKTEILARLRRVKAEMQHSPRPTF